MICMYIFSSKQERNVHEIISRKNIFLEKISINMKDQLFSYFNNKYWNKTRRGKKHNSLNLFNSNKYTNIKDCSHSFHNSVLPQGEGSRSRV